MVSVDLDDFWGELNYFAQIDENALILFENFSTLPSLLLLHFPFLSNGIYSSTI